MAKFNKVPKEVVDLVKAYMEGKTIQRDEKKASNETMIKSVNMSEDDEVEEVLAWGKQPISSIPKKRKGVRDSFLFTMNPNFIPKNPTTVGNILALEKIYGYISDFFYENEISFNCANSGSYQKMSHAIVPYTDPSSK